MSVYDNFAEEEEEVTQELVEEDAGIPDAAAAEDSEDELVFYLNLVMACRESLQWLLLSFAPKFGKGATT